MCRCCGNCRMELFQPLIDTWCTFAPLPLFLSSIARCLHRTCCLSPNPLVRVYFCYQKTKYTHKQVESKYPEQIKVFYSHSCDSIERLPEGGGIEVRASLHASGGGDKEGGDQKVFRPRLLVGADGLKSTVGRPVAGRQDGVDIQTRWPRLYLGSCIRRRLSDTLCASVFTSEREPSTNEPILTMRCIFWFPCRWYREAFSPISMRILFLSTPFLFPLQHRAA